ncbi:putative bifunctional diguanylate cyclase/phosphodiesterase [Planosporangium sp. 12N6]|uniref:putative bifunctional diguanylate cyclase/phosphodiesterase n=1 Tax=Planosporangium spinosum TaxID=3402278 RepID=UPI003CF83005
MRVPPWRDPTLVLLTVLSVGSLAWFALVPQTPHARAVAFWVVQPPLDLASAWFALRVARLPATPRPSRRLHLAFAVALALFTVGDTVQAVLTAVRHPVGGLTAGPAQTTFFAAGMALILLVMLTYPRVDKGAHAGLRFWLDSGTVLLGAGVLALAIVGTGAGTGTILLCAALMLTIALSATRLLLSGAAPMGRPAALLGLSDALLQGLGIYLSAVPHLHGNGAVVGLRLLPSVLIVAVFRVQELTVRAGEHHRRTRRHYSALPYIAVAVGYGALIVILPADLGARAWLGLAGVFGITTVVVVRQLVSLADNIDLIQQLDASLLRMSRQEERFRSLLMHSSDIVTVLDANFRFTFASPAVQRTLGWRPDEVIGAPVVRFLHPDDYAVLVRRFPAITATPGASITYQARYLHADGGWRWLEVVNTNLLADPSVEGYVSNARDVTEARVLQERLHREATHDALTGLPNRAVFSERLAAARATAAGLHVALIDLDDFKLINDELGHGVGDNLLVEIARRLRDGVRDGDTVARLGGDEFAVLLSGRTHAEADELLGRLAEDLQRPVSADGHDLLVQASIGVADADDDADPAELLRRADVAMYAAKERGKSRSARYDLSMDAQSSEDARLGAQLRQALDSCRLPHLGKAELSLAYQPIVRLPGGEVAGVEALIRWYHPERGPVRPDVFIPVAERNGLILPLGRWILAEACRQAVEWRTRFGAGAPDLMSVNVSARQLRDPGFAETVAEVLTETGIAPESLVVEVTETAVFDSGTALETLRALDRLGVGIALDDFGTGHSSLGLLRTCPANVLKVDKSFVDEIAVAGESVVIATALIEIAAGLDLRAVAEGVETRDQAEILYELGYRYAQGYHFSRPLSAAELSGKLEQDAACAA